MFFKSFLFSSNTVSNAEGSAYINFGEKKGTPRIEEIINSLKISELYPYGGALEIIIDILAKLFSFSRIISLIHYHLSRFITKTFIARKVFNITSHRYPLGYCLVAVKASK